MPIPADVIRLLYDRFNAREMDEILANLHPDVQWANGMEGGYIYGCDGVRNYWTRQWAMIDPHVEPLEIVKGDGDKFEVKVHQIVRDLEGNLLLDTIVDHVFQIDGRLITHFDIR